jgi:predicted transcriptional regulator
MASTTTLKLPEELKARIAAAAEHAGKTPHAFMVEALERQIERDEKRRSFVADALAAAADIDAGGPVYAMEDVAAYIQAKAAGKSPAWPQPANKTKPAARRKAG